MNVLFSKKQIFLLCMGTLICGLSHGLGVKHTLRKTFSVVNEATGPLSHNMACYTTCNQKVGRQGGEAFQDYFRQHASASGPEAMSLLQQPAVMPLSETEQHARRALRCLKACRLSVTVRFLAQFLSSVEDEHTMRAIGVVLGATAHEGRKQKNPIKVTQEEGEHTKLFGVVFNKAFHRGCLRVLRHEEAQMARFKKNLNILRQVFFEMYGPVKLAPQYAKAHGVR